MILHLKILHINTEKYSSVDFYKLTRLIFSNKVKLLKKTENVERSKDEDFEKIQRKILNFVQQEYTMIFLVEMSWLGGDAL